jgi:hypothetical protein
MSKVHIHDTAGNYWDFRHVGNTSLQLNLNGSEYIRFGRNAILPQIGGMNVDLGATTTAFQNLYVQGLKYESNTAGANEVVVSWSGNGGTLQNYNGSRQLEILEGELRLYDFGNSPNTSCSWEWTAGVMSFKAGSSETLAVWNVSANRYENYLNGNLTQRISTTYNELWVGANSAAIWDTSKIRFAIGGTVVANWDADGSDDYRGAVNVTASADCVTNQQAIGLTTGGGVNSFGVSRIAGSTITVAPTEKRPIRIFTRSLNAKGPWVDITWASTPAANEYHTKVSIVKDGGAGADQTLATKYISHYTLHSIGPFNTIHDASFEAIDTLYTTSTISYFLEVEHDGFSGSTDLSAGKFEGTLYAYQI